MDALDAAFKERLCEINEYLDFITSVEEQVRLGVPRLGADGPTITAAQQKILYSCVYLQLYNLIESTITKCIAAVCNAISEEKRWLPGNLTDEIRNEWVRFIVKGNDDSAKVRLERSIELCNHLINTLPVSSMEIAKGGGGNWDDEAIHRLAKRIGCQLAIKPESTVAIKRPYRNEKGALAWIVYLRNHLAHGEMSFVECGEEVTVAELKDLKDRTVNYLEDVVNSFNIFINDYKFLLPNQRPLKEA